MHDSRRLTRCADSTCSSSWEERGSSAQSRQLSDFLDSRTRSGMPNGTDCTRENWCGLGDSVVDISFLQCKKAHRNRRCNACACHGRHDSHNCAWRGGSCRSVLAGRQLRMLARSYAYRRAYIQAAFPPGLCFRSCSLKTPLAAFTLACLHAEMFRFE